MMTLPHDHGQSIEKHFEHMPKEESFQVVSDVFKLLSDRSRARIFWILCHCEECVMNISALMEMSSPAVSHHLRLLKDNGLITSRREGKEVYYRAAQTEQVKMLHMTIEKMAEITCI